MSKVTGTQVIDEVRRLAAESPDFVYETTGNVCRYIEADGVPGCIFGHALVNLGLIDSSVDIEETNASEVLSKLKTGAGRRQREWADSVQLAQDRGSAWADAVAEADKRAREASW